MKVAPIVLLVLGTLLIGTGIFLLVRHHSSSSKCGSGVYNTDYKECVSKSVVSADFKLDKQSDKLMNVIITPKGDITADTNPHYIDLYFWKHEKEYKTWLLVNGKYNAETQSFDIHIFNGSDDKGKQSIKLEHGQFIIPLPATYTMWHENYWAGRNDGLVSFTSGAHKQIDYVVDGEIQDENPDKNEV